MKVFMLLLALLVTGCTNHRVRSADRAEIREFSDRELCRVKTRFPQYFTKIAAEELETRDVGKCSIYYLGCKDLGYTPETPEFKACEIALWNESAPGGGGGGLVLPNFPAVTSCYKGDNSIHCIESNGGVRRRE